jgi:tetrapyrrole methylase family protein/MazG family protein
VPTVVVVGLGPAGPELMAAAAAAAIERVAPRYVRTMRHPSAPVVGEATTFDPVYDAAPSLDDVYADIVETLVVAARNHGQVLYAVPGSPLVAERSVALLRQDTRVHTSLVPSLSFLDLAWARLGVDPVASGVRLVDGRRFAVHAAGERGPLMVAQCDTKAVLSDIKVAVDGPSPPDVTVLHHLGLPDETVRAVPWDDLDRQVEPDHLTSLYIPSLAAPVGAELVRFAELVRTLRQRCPWDREQTHASLTRYLLEETYEVLEAIDAVERSARAATEGEIPAAMEQLADELGDLLFQVVFHATLAAEQGAFTLADVARGIHDKLVRRHPHVFADVEAETAGQVVRNWEEIKRAEKPGHGLMDGIAGNLPSLLYAHKVQRKAASVGFDWPSVEDVYPKVAEELAELQADPGPEEVGDLLFAAVNVARHLGVDPEVALRGATARFRGRFSAMERLAAARGLDVRALDLAALDALWDDVKRSGGG